VHLVDRSADYPWTAQRSAHDLEQSSTDQQTGVNNMRDELKVHGEVSGAENHKLEPKLSPSKHYSGTGVNGVCGAEMALEGGPLLMTVGCMLY
jgi:hypothetical protein